MRIVVNHLTRMRGGRICVAGVDIETRRHVRPVLPQGSLEADFLARYRGPFDMANVVDLGTPEHRPKPPHVEDHLFRPYRAKCIDTLDQEKFWALLYTLSKPGLRKIFGSDLRRVGKSSAGTDAGKGTASLGCLSPKRKPRLAFRGEAEFGPAIRIRVDEGEFDVWVSVTDIRLYQDDHATPDLAIVEKVRRRLERPGAVILSVGLTRAYATSADAKPIHWLQVNNIHLEHDPTWQLG
ncbi:MAG: hypothetical protein ABIP48_10785 [Planctomycetota bacterium]